MDTPRKGAFQFVQLSHPQDAASWKRQVRSHAAKNARVRQKRVVQYQNDKAKEAPSRPEHPQQPKTPVAGSIITALGAGRTDPFDSFARKVTKMENFLLDHFVRHVVLHVVTCYPLRTLSDEMDFRQGMATHWVQMAATDTGMLATLFLASCRNLSNYQHEEFYATLALQYKGQCITTLKSALEHEGDMISDATITKTLALASEATLAGDVAAEKQHVQAAEKMVSMRGGIETLGMSGFLKKMIIWFIRQPCQSGNGNRLLTPTCMPPASITIAGFVGVATRQQWQ